VGACPYIMAVLYVVVKENQYWERGSFVERNFDEDQQINVRTEDGHLIPGDYVGLVHKHWTVRQYLLRIQKRGYNNEVRERVGNRGVCSEHGRMEDSVREEPRDDDGKLHELAAPERSEAEEDSVVQCDDLDAGEKSA